MCPAFWEACDETWSDSTLAVSGRVLNRFETPLGGVTLRVEPSLGSIVARDVLIHNVSLGEHPTVKFLEPDDEFGAVGLIPEGERERYRLPPWGLLASSKRGDP
jgi:hypothetical protein